MKFTALFASSFLFGLNLFSQQLFINEVSQGESGSFEYVEFVVVGNATCQSPPPCLDMRGIIIDDNNGDFRTGSGSGIATGAMRFANIPFWQCIPQGTIIVIYSETDRNSAIPPDDISMSDNNGRLIISASSTLLERHETMPSNSNNNYSSTGWLSGGEWATVGMANAQDSYQIRQNVSSTSASHSVSWGSNNQNTIIYFSGAAGGLVFSMMNTTNNNPSTQSNWASASAATGQTPGVGNSSANQAWINSMSSTGGGNITLIVSSTNTGCGSTCTGTASVTASGGTAPYTYSWSNGEITQSVSGLCAQTYTIDVTDDNGCSASEQVTITAASNTLSATASSTNETCPSMCNGSVSVTVSGGTTPYTYLWSNGAITSSSSALCPQTYSVTVTDAQGCSTNGQATVGINPSTIVLSVNSTNESCLNACNGSVSVSASGGTAPYAYSWSTSAITPSVSDLCAQTYSVTVTDDNGCTAIGQTTVSSDPNPLVLSTTSTNESCDNLCDGSASVSVSGGATPYIYGWNNGGNSASIQNLCDGNYTVTVTDQDGCQATANQSVLPGAAGQTPVISPAGPFTTTDAPSQLNASITGGVWSANCTNCITSTGIFNPQAAGAGTHQICYTIGSGACAETACISITVTEGCQTQHTSEIIDVCPGESIVFEGQEITVAGNYDFNYQTANGCDSIHTVQFGFFTTSPVNDFVTVCMGDSVEVNGTWYFQQTIANFETIDVNGCILQNTTTITFYDCNIPPYNVFIPNTFTPNGDLTNDVFPISITGGVLENGFIMNRWGQIVKEFSATDLTWDGKTQSGENAPDGVYTYMVIVQKDAGVTEQFHGFVTLIR